MADNFDIMKPISSDLDIGSTMFDASQQSSVQAQAVAAAPTPSKDKGVYHVDYGYLTPQELAALSLIPNEVVTSKAFDGVSGAVGSSSSLEKSPLDRAISELNALRVQHTTAAAGSSASIRAAQSVAKRGGDNAGSTDKSAAVIKGIGGSVKLIRIVFLVIFAIAFGSSFIPFILSFLLNILPNLS